MSEFFNVKYDTGKDVAELQQKADYIKAYKQRLKVLYELYNGDGKEVDITRDASVFEAINREKLDFETILRLHPDQAKDAMEQVKIDRGSFSEGKYWNPKSKAKWGLKGHIPTCIYYSRPKEYWNNEKLTNMFFNSFPAFRISTKPL
ncbi:MAG: hypothetical protein WC444_07310 [Candidatus Paceibacterota bacterium]